MATDRSPALRTQAASSADGIGIVVVDPLPVVRAGLALLISEAEDMEVLGEAGSSEAALDIITKLRRPRLVTLVGLDLPGDHDAYWLIRNLRERYPMRVILGCGAGADAGLISRALFVGADGYVDKSIDPATFLQGIRRGSNKEMVLASPRELGVARLVDGIERHRRLVLRLTDREREVLSAAAEGLTAREIASRLGVRERTITTHLARIYGKLGVGNRLSAIRLAARAGLVSIGGLD